jgi:uncharacterized protein YidB (DUF937 family)
MSLLDNLLGSNAAGLVNRVLGAAQTAQANTGVDTRQILQSLVNLIEHPSTGGLSGLLQTFESVGLGREVGSWVGTGANLPISADQVRSALGDSRLQEIATRLGIAPGSVSAAVSHVLPSVVDQLTPNGQVPPSGELQKGIELLKQAMHH